MPIKQIIFEVEINNHSIDNLNLQWSDIDNIHEHISSLIVGYINHKTNDKLKDIIDTDDIDDVFKIITIVKWCINVLLLHYYTIIKGDLEWKLDQL